MDEKYLTKEEVNALEDAYLMELNILAGLDANVKYDYYRIAHKTHINKHVFDAMLCKARELSKRITFEGNGGINTNWPFEVIDTYFAPMTKRSHKN